jgi:saccharopine dehydrogenase-like NADP-dependent oxidoreductase
MHNILIVGAGRIGSLISLLLADAGYKVILADAAQITPPTVKLDVTDSAQIKSFFQQHNVDTIVSCLPYQSTTIAAEIAQQYCLNYFDLTEDIHASKTIQNIAQSATTAFVPQCGLAPGLVGFLAYDLMSQFESVTTARLRVGGLPQYAHNTLHYVITWSVDGLINGYANPCHVINNKKSTYVQPLENCEELEIDGMVYEAFNTSGGLGHLVELCEGKVEQLSYKTIRYPGHCEKMRFLMQDLKLGEDRITLKRILENALPESQQDVVVLDISVMGRKNKHFIEESIVKKYYPREIQGKTYAALQITTAASACAVIDVVLQDVKQYQGLVFQEKLPLAKIKQNRFAHYLF